VVLDSADVTLEVATGDSSTTAGISTGASLSRVLGLLSQAPMDSGRVELEREILGFFGGLQACDLWRNSEKRIPREAQFIVF